MGIFDWLAFLGSISGVLSLVLAFLINWKMEKHKSELKELSDQRTHISKELFNKEMKVYEEIWRIIIDFKNDKINNLGKTLGLKEAFKKKEECFKELKKQILKKKPSFSFDEMDEKKTAKPAIDIRKISNDLIKLAIEIQNIIDAEEPFIDGQIVIELRGIIATCKYKAMCVTLEENENKWDEKEIHDLIANCSKSIRKRLQTYNVER